MKKILLLAAVVLCSLVSMAQTFAPAKNMLVKSPVATMQQSRQQVKHQADIKDSQYIIGHYNSNSIDENGIGLRSATTFEAATIIPAEFYDGMQNLKVDGIRYGLTLDSKVNSVKLYGLTNENITTTPLVTKEVTTTSKKGWNYVEFDKPFEVNGTYDALIAAYEIELPASTYAIGMYSGADLNSASFIGYGPFGQNNAITWADFGTDYGTVAIQLVCSCDPAEGYTVKPVRYACPTMAIGATFKPVFTVSSTSEGEVSSIDYLITFGGQDYSGTYTFKTPIPAGFCKKGEFEVELTAPQTAGAVPVITSITAINGKELDTYPTQTFVQNIVTRKVARYNIVEEFTGTGCGYCPLGWCGMEYVKENMSATAGVIAIHQYNSNDPMYGTYYHTPDFSGAPQCAINRMTMDIPPYAEYMKEYLPQFQQYLPEVEVTVNAHFDNTMTKIAASAETEFLTDLEGSELVFVLTADNLSGNTTSWKQSNYLSQSAYTTNYPASSKDFFKGGKYGSSSVALTFNDVMIGSSWPSATAANAVKPFSTTTAGEKVASTYNLSVPSKTTLKAALKMDQLNVTAMVIKADGTVANAARCKVEMPEGIGTVLNDNDNHNDNNYDLSGRMINAQSKGLMIQGGKKILR